jgi:hypothetical protein
MKMFTVSRLVPILTASLLLTAPVCSIARDKHHHHGHNHYSGGRGAVYVSSPRYYSSRGYCAPYRSSYYNYGPYYSGSYYGSGYYAPRASIGFSLFTSPTYSSSRYYPSSYSRAGSSDDLAIDVQRALRRSGHYYGDIDGDIGPESRAAIREYQRDRGLPVTGRIDNSLLRSLRIG